MFRCLGEPVCGDCVEQLVTAVCWWKGWWVWFPVHVDHLVKVLGRDKTLLSAGIFLNLWRTISAGRWRGWWESKSRFWSVRGFPVQFCWFWWWLHTHEGQCCVVFGCWCSLVNLMYGFTVLMCSVKAWSSGPSCPPRTGTIGSPSLGRSVQVDPAVFLWVDTSSVSVSCLDTGPKVSLPLNKKSSCYDSTFMAHICWTLWRVNVWKRFVHIPRMF